MVVAPTPDNVPPFQVKPEVTVRELLPVTVPLRVRLPTVTAVSSVTVWPLETVAVSVDPGTPAPPHVLALLQFPLCVLVNVAAAFVATSRRRTDNELRTPIRVIGSTPRRFEKRLKPPLTTGRDDFLSQFES